jgi:hypothetical protein
MAQTRASTLNRKVFIWAPQGRPSLDVAIVSSGLAFTDVMGHVLQWIRVIQLKRSWKGRTRLIYGESVSPPPSVHPA